MDDGTVTQPQSSQNALRKRLRNPLLRVVSTWIWWAVGAILTSLLITVLMGGKPSDFTTVLSENRHLIVYIEFVSVGLLPLLYTWICRDDLGRYGFQRNGLGRSLLLSGIFVAVMFTFGYLMSGEIISDSRETLIVTAPWNY